MAESPYFKVDINCTKCQKLMALTNAVRTEHDYLCPTCFSNMAEPTKKNPAIEEFIDSITPNPLGRRGSISANVCSYCKGDASNFRDDLSRKEYTISGWCQSCQDKTFGR